jgi:Nuclease-related domain
LTQETFLNKPRSPLKTKPLRYAGQSIDEEVQRLIDDQAMPYVAAVMGLWAVTVMEWIATWRNLPRQPWLFTILAIGGTVWLAWRVARVREHLRALRLGRDGERVVGQFLEGLRETGARIFHDIPADGFNLDHVVISTRGIYVVETKTHSKPSGHSKVVYDGETVTVGGLTPDRDPVRQVTAEADWLQRMLQDSTGRSFAVRGVVVYPGWWVEPIGAAKRSAVWVLEPKALPAFIGHANEVIVAEDVALAAFHLSRYVRGNNSDA